MKRIGFVIAAALVAAGIAFATTPSPSAASWASHGAGAEVVPAIPVG